MKSQSVKGLIIGILIYLLIASQYSVTTVGGAISLYSSAKSQVRENVVNHNAVVSDIKNKRLQFKQERGGESYLDAGYVYRTMVGSFGSEIKSISGLNTTSDSKEVIITDFVNSPLYPSYKYVLAASSVDSVLTRLDTLSLLLPSIYIDYEQKLVTVIVNVTEESL